VVIALGILVFVPIRYIYPSRSPRLRALTNSLGVLWAIAVLLLIYWLPEPPRPLALVSLSFPLYYILVSLWLEFGRSTS
jgi:phosphatidylcholine synthase